MSLAGLQEAVSYYLIREWDTPIKVAQDYTGDPSRFHELVEINKFHCLPTGVVVGWVVGTVIQLPPVWDERPAEPVSCGKTEEKS